jgi:hypothetical protein
VPGASEFTNVPTQWARNLLAKYPLLRRIECLDIIHFNDIDQFSYLIYAPTLPTSVWVRLSGGVQHIGGMAVASYARQESVRKDLSRAIIEALKSLISQAKPLGG